MHAAVEDDAAETNRRPLAQADATQFRLTFEPKTAGAPVLVFPCDESGLVDIDSLAEEDRNNLILASAMMGRDVYPPIVVRLQ